MIRLQEKTRVYIALTPTDFRKSINGLSACVLDELSLSPQSGDCYLFWNKSRNKVKILFWDNNGFVLYYKRLEKGRFKIPRDMNFHYLEVTQDQLDWLLAGLDFMLMKQFNQINYSAYY